MKKAELIYLATKAVGKGYDYEKMIYSDDLYGKEKHTDEVWEYVEELETIGSLAFREKYKDFKMY